MSLSTYVTLFLFYPIGTLLFWGLMKVPIPPLGIQLEPIYKVLKPFYIILFILWINKYFTYIFTKLLGLNEEDNKPEEDFFRKQIKFIFG
jgi:hypothetical protein